MWHTMSTTIFAYVADWGENFYAVLLGLFSEGNMFIVFAPIRVSKSTLKPFIIFKIFDNVGSTAPDSYLPYRDALMPHCLAASDLLQA